MNQRLIWQLTKKNPNYAQCIVDDEEIWRVGKYFFSQSPSSITIDSYLNLKLTSYKTFSNRSKKIRSNRFRRNLERLYLLIKHNSGIGIWSVSLGFQYEGCDLGYVFSRGKSEAEKFAKLLYGSEINYRISKQPSSSKEIWVRFVHWTKDPRDLKNWQDKKIKSIDVTVLKARSEIKGNILKIKELENHQELLKNVVNSFIK